MGEAYRAVKKCLGEGEPWLFDDQTIIDDLNRSARDLCSEAQALYDTYQFNTAINPLVAGGGTFYQEYAMPMSCEAPLDGKVQIGTLWPLDFSATQSRIQTGGFVSGAPVIAYLRRGVTLTQQVPTSSEIVFTPPGFAGAYAPYVIGLYPVPAAVYPVWINYIAYHPPMNNPEDVCLLPDKVDVFEAWTAYAKYKGMEAQGDSVDRQNYWQQFMDGRQLVKNYLLGQKIQVTPPQWGGGQGSLYAQGLSIIVQAPTAANLAID